MRTIVLGTFILSTLLLTALIVIGIKSTYRYEAEILSEWTLADRSSTIPAKREHIDKFVNKVSAAGLNGTHNALLFPTDENSFDSNFVALKTLQSRLHEIEGMDVRSFEYQTAIQQITAQEQHEAHEMLGVIGGAWQMKHYFPLWDWVGLLIYAGLAIVVIFFGMTVLSLLWDL